MQQSKESLSDELVRLMNRLSLNGDIHMAGRVLHAYATGFWRLERKIAREYVIQYFQENYPKQLQRYLKKRKKIRS
ncbi:hypothetical protein GCM10023228_25870 [Brevibacillus fulvus]|uniref:Uncharacterized protein n=1 Tax=Brevibacillus fulvus TaxID=1125967 RepID=A0A938Y2M2_9BACL|nr:hypothetical protein [Brevibacillus fulvus]